MTRRPFGGGAGDYVDQVDAAGVIHVAAGTVCQLWDSEVQGTQIVDLTDALANPITQVTTTSIGQVPLFFGPNDGTTELWIDAGGVDRRLLISTDMGSRLSALETLTTALNTAVYGVKTLVGYVASSAADILFSSTLPTEILPRVSMTGDGHIYMSDAPMAIVAVTYSGSTVTPTTASPHNYQVNDVVDIANISGVTNVNGEFTVTAIPTSTTFTYTATSTPTGAYTSGGVIQRQWGSRGAPNEGIWNIIQNSLTKVGLSIRGIYNATGNLLLVVDYKNQPIFSVPPFGGAAMFGDNFRVFAGSDIINPVIKLRSVDGTIQMVKGDPGGGGGVLAIGNAGVVPSVAPDGSHTLDGSTTVAGVVLYSSNGLLLVQRQSGVIEEVGHNYTRRDVEVFKDVGAATVTTVGTPAVTVDGTATSADNPLGYSLVQITTGTTSGNHAGIVPASFTQSYCAWTPSYYSIIYTDTDITNIRVWAGMFSADPNAVSSPTSLHCFAFRYDTSVDTGAFWRLVTSAAGTPTVVTSSIAIAVSTQYRLRAEVNNSNTFVRFLINGVVAGTISTTLPTYNQPIAPAVRVTTLTAAAKSINFSRQVVNQVG